MYVTGFFMYEKDAPTENWLLNSIESLIGSTTSLPTDWLQIIEISTTTVWSLLFSLATERIEKERLSIPVAVFQCWEQQKFKALLKETMDKSAIYKFKPKEKKCKE